MPQVLTQLLVDAVPNMRVSYVVIIGLVEGSAVLVLGFPTWKRLLDWLADMLGFITK